MPDLMPLASEIVLLVMTCLVMVVDLYLKDEKRVVTYWLSQLTIMLTMLAVLWVPFTGKAEILYSGHFVHDNLAIVLKIAAGFATMLMMLYSRPYINQRNFLRGEYYMLALLSYLGMHVLISAHSLLTIYLGLELLSLPLYAMVAMQRDNKTASEAAIKYFVMGALASGFILYGMSLVYGITGTIQIENLAEAIPDNINQLGLQFACVFIVAGLAFKLGAVPFHMWIPDIYEGAPSAVTSFIASAPKIAAFGMIIRLLVEAMPSLAEHWKPMLMVLAFMSMAIGNIIALAQENIKRLLAYSAIAHMGYFLLGIIAGGEAGNTAALFYILVYALMSLGAFGIVILMSTKECEYECLSNYKGLAKRNPWFAVIMLFIMMSMAGIPPFIGFWAKLEVIKAAVNADLLWLAISAVVFSVIGLYYYLKIAKIMFFDAPEEDHALEMTLDLKFVLSLNGVLLLVVGLMPNTLLAVCGIAF